MPLSFEQSMDILQAYRRADGSRFGTFPRPSDITLVIAEIFAAQVPAISDGTLVVMQVEDAGIRHFIVALSGEAAGRKDGVVRPALEALCNDPAALIERCHRFFGGWTDYGTHLSDQSTFTFVLARNPHYEPNDPRINARVTSFQGMQMVRILQSLDALDSPLGRATAQLGRPLLRAMIRKAFEQHGAAFTTLLQRLAGLGRQEIRLVPQTIGPQRMQARAWGLPPVPVPLGSIPFDYPAVDWASNVRANLDAMARNQPKPHARLALLSPEHKRELEEARQIIDQGRHCAEPKAVHYNRQHGGRRIEHQVALWVGSDPVNPAHRVTGNYMFPCDICRDNSAVM